MMSACQTLPNSTADEAPSQVYTGRFSVSFMKDGQTHREQGGFDWKVKQLQKTNAEAAMSLAINSPLGITLATIAFNPNEQAGEKASLQTMAQRYTAADLDSLMQNTLGWRLPIAGLLPWMGNQAPEQQLTDWVIKMVSRHENGSPKVISADNSKLNISARLVFEAFAVPGTSITIVTPTEQ